MVGQDLAAPVQHARQVERFAIEDYLLDLLRPAACIAFALQHAADLHPAHVEEGAMVAAKAGKPIQ